MKRLIVLPFGLALVLAACESPPKSAGYVEKLRDMGCTVSEDEIDCNGAGHGSHTRGDVIKAPVIVRGGWYCTGETVLTSGKWRCTGDLIWREQGEQKEK